MTIQDNHIQHIAIAGASGNLGTSILTHLFSSTSPTFHITAITRENSSAIFPSSSHLSIAKGSLDNLDFLTHTLKGVDVLIIALSFLTPPSQTSLLSRAAALAGVRYIIPTEFGSDTANASLVGQIPLIAHKPAWRAEIESFAAENRAKGNGANGPRWIAIITNPWLEMGILRGGWGINLKERKATLWTDGDGKPVKTRGNTTTLGMVGEAVARLLALPVSPSLHGGSAGAGTSKTLETYGNDFVYLRTFSVTQSEILEAVQTATNTTNSDWMIERTPLKQHIQEGKDAIAAGDMMGNVALVYGLAFAEGFAEYSGELANEVLGLGKGMGTKEEFEEVVRGVVGVGGG